MKPCAVNETQLNDHLDQRLSPDESEQVERHLAECAACRDCYDDLVALRVLAADLPKSLEPDRDLWPQIASRLAKSTGQPGGKAVARLQIFRLFIAAAACLLIGLGLYKELQNRAPRAVASDIAFESGLTIDDQMRDEIAKAESAYQDAADGFLAQLNADNTLMTPDSRKVLEGNLAITNKAIEEVRDALEKRPGDFKLARKLLATHELRVELLQQATQLSFAIRNGG